jgi:hypothetical protein
MRMVKANRTLGCILAVLALGAGAARADNLLVNGDFESGDLAGWLVFGESPNSSVVIQSGDNGPAGPGTYSAYLNNQAQALALLIKQSTEVGVATGGPTMYSFDLKLDQADLGGVVFVQIFAEQSGVGIIGGSGLLGPFWPWNAWATFSGSFEAPANTDFLTIQIEAVTGATVGSNCKLHVDNVVLDQGTVATEARTWSGVKVLYR